MKKFTILFFITLTMIIPSAQADVIIETFQKVQRYVVPIYQHTPCSQEQLKQISIFDKKSVSNANSTSGSCGLQSCLLELYTSNQNQKLQYYEQLMNGECTLKEANDIKRYDSSIFRTRISIKIKTEHKSIRKIKLYSKFGRSVTKRLKDDVLTVSLVYHKKPTFDVITIDNVDHNINFKNE